MIFALSLFLMFPGDVNLEQSRISKVLRYPDELIQPLPDFKALEKSAKKQEFVEVSSESYPGLNIDLPEMNDFLKIEKFQFRDHYRGPGYFDKGGMILSWYGINEPSGQLFSASVLPELEESETEDP